MRLSARGVAQEGMAPKCRVSFGAKAAFLALALVTFMSQLYLLAVVYEIFEISDALDLVPTVCFAETKETLDIFSAYTFDKLVSNAPSVLR